MVVGGLNETRGSITHIPVIGLLVSLADPIITGKTLDTPRFILVFPKQTLDTSNPMDYFIARGTA